MVGTVLKTLKVSERRVCRVLGQTRSTQRYNREVKSEEKMLTEEIVDLATRYGRYGYRRITTLLNQEGWKVNCKMSRKNMENRGPEGAKEAAKAGQALVK